VGLQHLYNMHMLIMGILTWGVALYGFKVAFSGAPLVALVRATPPPVLQQAAQVLTSDEDLEDEDASAFLRHFYYLSLGVLAMLGLELSLAAYFAWNEPKFILPWLVAGKNLVVILVGWQWKQQHPESQLFAAVSSTPSWLMLLDRASHLVTGVIFVMLFLKLNRVWPGP
jgi:hypothetical protein